MGGDRGEERSKISDDLSWRISRSTDEEVDGDAHSPEGERSVVTLAADLQEAAAALAVGRRVAEALQAQAAVAAAAAAAARETQSELEEAHTWAQAALEQGQQRERERQQQAQNAAGSKRRRSDTDDEDLSDPAAIQQEIARLQGILQEKRLETRLSARVKQPADGWESLVNRDLAFPELLDSAGSALKLWGQLVTTNLHLAVPANAEWVISGEHIHAHCSIVDDFTALTDGDGGGLSLSLLPLTESGRHATSSTDTVYKRRLDWGEDHQWELNPRGTMELWAANSFLGALTHGIVKEQNDMPGEQLLVMFDALHVDYDAFTADTHAGLVKSQRKVRIRDAHGNLVPGLLIVKVATAAPFMVTVLVNTMHTRAQLDAVAQEAYQLEAAEAERKAAQDAAEAERKAAQAERKAAQAERKAAQAERTVVPAASVSAANATVKQHGDWFGPGNRRWCANCEDWFACEQLTRYHPANSTEGGAQGVAARHRKAVEQSAQPST